MPLLLASGELSLSTGSHGFSLTNPQTVGLRLNAASLSHSCLPSGSTGQTEERGLQQCAEIKEIILKIQTEKQHVVIFS